MAKMIVSTEKCKGCGICGSVCPQKIITYDKNIMNDKGYRPATLTNELKCTGCSMCAMMCPDCAIIIEK